MPIKSRIRGVPLGTQPSKADHTKNTFGPNTNLTNAIQVVDKHRILAEKNIRPLKQWSSVTGTVEPSCRGGDNQQVHFVSQHKMDYDFVSMQNAKMTKSQDSYKTNVNAIRNNDLYYSNSSGLNTLDDLYRFKNAKQIVKKTTIFLNQPRANQLPNTENNQIGYNGVSGTQPARTLRTLLTTLPENGGDTSVSERIQYVSSLNDTAKSTNTNVNGGITVYIPTSRSSNDPKVKTIQAPLNDTKRTKHKYTQEPVPHVVKTTNGMKITLQKTKTTQQVYKTNNQNDHTFKSKVVPQHVSSKRVLTNNNMTTRFSDNTNAGMVINKITNTSRQDNKFQFRTL